MEAFAEAASFSAVNKISFGVDQQQKICMEAAAVVVVESPPTLPVMCCNQRSKRKPLELASDGAQFPFKTLLPAYTVYIVFFELFHFLVAEQAITHNTMFGFPTVN